MRNVSAGLFGIPAGFLVTWVVSLMTREPSKDMQDFIEFVRVPSARLAESNPYAQGLKN
jgi:cation/acetate symporter